MPRKAAAPKSTAAADEAKPEGTRRSTRIADKPVSTSGPAAPAKKAPKPKGKRAVEKDVEAEEAEPVAKKAKPASEEAESAMAVDVAVEPAAGPAPAEPAAEPALEAAAVEPVEAAEPVVEAAAEPEPSPKAATKPNSKAAKPASKASASKPASKAAASKPASKKATRGHAATATAAEPAITEEDEEKAVSEQMEVEDKENQKEEVKAAAAEAEVEVGELQLGDSLPDWTFKNEKDEDVEIAKLAGEKGLVLFMVPKADTPGCTTQACGFRDSYEDFEKYGYAVYGLSADTSAAQAKWQTKKNLQYSLISDPKRKLIHVLGAKNGSSTKRSHVVFEKGSGKLIEKKIGVKPTDSPKHALEFIKKHHPNDA
ncbi:hypothetical protein FRB94_011520 [Tulasnella sp. JGI-2019a]|nr:hypothetical protein FRB93_009795 [Tulasnella sp. JGI-2019a]KAG8992526.1 hypothetical protein FRB94_011520 [Tulasnella sp. JGI-2019a]